MTAPQSLAEVRDDSDLIVVGRPIGSQEWVDPQYASPHFLLTFEITDVIEGDPTFNAPGVVQIVATQPLPSGNVSDLDHLLLLVNREQQERKLDLRVDPGDEYLYYLTDGFLSVYANVEGRVVTPEYAAVKRAYGDRMFTTALDGTSFDALVTMVRNAATSTAELSRHTPQHSDLFAC